MYSKMEIPWTRLENSFYDHHKVINMASLLRVRPVLVQGMMVRLWCWLLRQENFNGQIEIQDPIYLEREILQWDGEEGQAIDAAKGAGFLEEKSEKFFAKNFAERIKDIKRSRDATRKRNERHRKHTEKQRNPEKKCPEHVHKMSKNVTTESHRCHEKNAVERERERENIHYKDQIIYSNIDQYENGQTGSTAPDGAHSADASSDTKKFNHHLSEAKKVQAYYIQKFPRREVQATCSKNTRHIINRLKEGYTPEKLIQAIDGCLASSFHADGGYNKLELIMRSSAQVDQFLERSGKEEASQKFIDRLYGREETTV